MMLGSVQAIGLGRRRDQYTREVADNERSYLEERIAKSLSKVHPRLAQMWHGSWETLRSGSSDCLRQAAHSAREALIQLLHEIAPDAAFSAEEIRAHGHKGNVTRKMRIARILGTEAGSSRVEYIDKTAALGSSLYDVLSARAHDRADSLDEREVRFYLMEVGNIVVLLLGDE
jgi:hypothetical protein